MENLDQKVKDNFFNNNLLPILKKYYSFLQNISVPKDLLNKLAKNAVDTTKDYNKRIIVVSPDSMQFLNDVNHLKAEQPSGIELSFPPQQKKKINSLIDNLSYMFALEKYPFSDNQTKKKLNELSFTAETIFKDSGETQIKQIDDVQYVSLNEWVQSLVTKEVKISENNSILFAKLKNSNESQFLSKIKKFLLQKKINSLIETKKRSFVDILAGVPAYSEVLFYEIKKYDKNTLLQSILIPNTKELDFYKYFDTQVKLKTEYEYKVKAWTLIIGNKYKYLDRKTHV